MEILIEFSMKGGGLEFHLGFYNFFFQIKAVSDAQPSRKTQIHERMFSVIPLCIDMKCSVTKW